MDDAYDATRQLPRDCVMDPRLEGRAVVAVMNAARWVTEAHERVPRRAEPVEPVAGAGEAPRRSSKLASDILRLYHR